MSSTDGRQIDDHFVGEVTEPKTLEGLCHGIEVVFSSVGLIRQEDRSTSHSVEYQENKNILDRALQAAKAPGSLGRT